MGLALLLGPLCAYPGNWSTVAPVTPAAQSAWATFGAIVYAAIAVGIVLTFLETRALFRAWRLAPEGSARRSLADVLGAPSQRWPLVVAAVGYLVLVGWFLSLFGWSLDGPGFVSGSFPVATNVLCCGPVGTTPVVALILAPTFELVAYPVVVVTVFGATMLFSLNVASVFALLRSRRSASAVGSGALSTVGALFVNCPACGTILLANVVAGTAAAGLFVAWAAYSVPLMLVSFPLAGLALYWNGHQLSRLAAGGAACAIVPPGGRSST